MSDVKVESIVSTVNEMIETRKQDIDTLNKKSMSIITKMGFVNDAVLNNSQKVGVLSAQLNVLYELKGKTGI